MYCWFPLVSSDRTESSVTKAQDEIQCTEKELQVEEEYLQVSAVSKTRTTDERWQDIISRAHLKKT